MHPRGFPKSGISPISPWPGYPNIPIFLDTSREEPPIPESKRTSVTSFDTSDRSPVSPIDEKAPPFSPPKGSPSTTLQIPSSETKYSEKFQSESTERSPVRHLSPVEYPSVSKISESWTTRYTKPRTPKTPKLQETRQTSLHRSPVLRSSTTTPRYSPKSVTENASGLGIIDETSHEPGNYALPRYPGEEKSSLNIAERIEDRLWQYSIHGNVFKRWLLEFISWSISAACMAALVGVLMFLKDKPLRSWPLASSGITLNTFVATLSRIASAALLLPVSEALGQLKWIWFFEGTSKKMWDFEIFDNASRGPWGSFQLLIRTKGRKLAALGAGVVLFALALDPFFQQILDFPERWTLFGNNCTIPRISRYEPIYAKAWIGDIEAVTKDSDLTNAADTFFYSNGPEPKMLANGTQRDFSISCPTSNCTWPVYETLGMCSSCADISHLLTFTCMETVVDWVADLAGSGPSGNETEFPRGPVCGYFLNATGENPILMSGYALESDAKFSGETLLSRTLPLTTNPQKQPLYGDGSIMFKNHRNPIIDVLIVGAADGPSSVHRNETPVALECVLSWCVKTMKSSYSMASYSEEVMSTFVNTTKGPFPWYSEPITLDDFPSTYIEYTQELELDVKDYPLPSGATPRNPIGYGVSTSTAFNTITVFDEIFPSFVTVKKHANPWLLRYAISYTGPAYQKEVGWKFWGLPNNVPNTMDRLATALTDKIRGSQLQEPIQGSSYEQETYIIVRWEWITLPVALLLFSLIFLLLTILKTSMKRDAIGVWKTSAVATLLYGFPDDMQQKIASNTHPGCTPRTQAKELKVKLDPEKRWRVSGNLLSPWTTKSKEPPPPPGWI